MEKGDIFDRIMGLPGLRIFEPFYQRHREVLLYVFFGGLTTVLSIGSFAWFYAMGLNELVANVLSWILAVLFAYVTNSTWVFSAHPETMGERLRQMASFYGGRVATLAMEEAVLFLGITLLRGNAVAVKTLAQILVFVGNYVISKWLVFRKRA